MFLLCLVMFMPCYSSNGVKIAEFTKVTGKHGKHRKHSERFSNASDSHKARASARSVERFGISHDYRWTWRWTPSELRGTRCRWEDVAGRKFIVYGYTYNIARRTILRILRSFVPTTDRNSSDCALDSNPCTILARIREITSSLNRVPCCMRSHVG